MQEETLKRKREDYADMVVHYFGKLQAETVTGISNKNELSQYEKKSMK